MNNKTRIILTQVNRWLPLLAIGMLPIKLSLSYLFLFPAIIVSLLLDVKKFQQELRQVAPLLLPLYLFIAYALIAAIFGFGFLNSTTELLKLFFLTGSVLVFKQAFNNWGVQRCCWLLVFSQSLAAYYSIFEARLPDLRYIFLGTVTESGQLALVIPLALGLYQLKDCTLKLSDWLLGLLTLSLAVLLAFSKHLQIISNLQFTFVALLAFVMIYNYKKLSGYFKSNIFTAANATLIAYFLPIVTAALIVNLKRGPWLGVLIASCCFLFFRARKLTYAVIIVSIIMVASINPLRERLADSSKHFSIAGGRQVMWSIAGDLLTRYPLGTGYATSAILQKFAREIPAEHKHFHSNYINIAVETGLIGSALFAWWLLRILRLGLSHWRKSANPELLLAATCALLAWSLAGLVEYNFGDSEVLLVVFFMIALIAKLLKQPALVDQHNVPVNQV